MKVCLRESNGEFVKVKDNTIIFVESEIEAFLTGVFNEDTEKFHNMIETKERRETLIPMMYIEKGFYYEMQIEKNHESYCFERLITRIYHEGLIDLESIYGVQLSDAITYVSEGGNWDEVEYIEFD